MLIFCLTDAPNIVPFPRLMCITVWLRMSSCTAKDASTHQCTTKSSPTFRTRVKCRVVIRYLIILASFRLSSSSGDSTLVQWNATEVCRSRRARFDKYKHCAVRLRYCSLICFGSLITLSLFHPLLNKDEMVQMLLSLDQFCIYQGHLQQAPQYTNIFVIRPLQR